MDLLFLCQGMASGEVGKQMLLPQLRPFDAFSGFGHGGNNHIHLPLLQPVQHHPGGVLKQLEAYTWPHGRKGA
ncbi:hypothetical protein D3C71_1883710 [compost metagenome]